MTDDIRRAVSIGEQETIKIRGLDKDGLLRFFSASGRKNLVLRIVDVLEMRNDTQDFLIQLAAKGKSAIDGTAEAIDSVKRLLELDPPGWRRNWLLRRFPSGWVVVSIKEVVEPLTFEELLRLQAILLGYAQIRLEKGEPSRVDPCGRCGGSGRTGDRRCRECDGGGQITTFLEVSEEERRLAEGLL